MKVGSKIWKNYLINKCGVPKEMIGFLAKGVHFKFEKADERNDIKFFEDNWETHGEFFDYHFKSSFPTFSFYNYRMWKSANNIEDKWVNETKDRQIKDYLEQENK